MSKLKELCDRCKCSAYVTVNEHRTRHQTAQQYIDEALNEPEPLEIDPDMRLEMIRRDSVVRCQFYPRTSVGFDEVWHYDVDACIEICLGILDQLAREGHL